MTYPFSINALPSGRLSVQARAKSILKSLQALLRRDEQEEEQIRANLNTEPLEDLPALVRRAQSADTPPETLAALAGSPSFQVQYHVGQNPRTPIEALTRLALSTQLWLAIADDTPPATLAALTRSPTARVRYFAGKNPHTPIEALTRLARDRGKCKNGRVFFAILENPRTPPELLARFVESREASARALPISNPGIPSECLSRLAGDEDERVCCCNIAGNPRTPVDILAVLAEDADEYVREEVAKNARTPADILAVLAEDTDESVRWAALETLAASSIRSASSEPDTTGD